MPFKGGDKGRMSKASCPASGSVGPALVSEIKYLGLSDLSFGGGIALSLFCSQSHLTSTEHHFAEGSVYSTVVYSEHILPGRNFLCGCFKVRMHFS